jgi:hypothetical protein
MHVANTPALSDLTTESVGEQTYDASYIAEFGQARVSKTVTRTNSVENTDGTMSRQENTILYYYDANGKQNEQVGLGTSYSDDGHGNITEGTSSQVYANFHGQFKVVQTVSNGTSRNIDGSGGVSENTVVNHYDEQGNGILINVTGSGWSLSHDDGGRYTRSTTVQEYDMSYYRRLGLIKLDFTTTSSYSSNAAGEGSFETPVPGTDDAWTRQRITVKNKYDQQTGRLTGAESTEGEGLSNDGFNNLTSSSIHQIFEVIGGDLRLIQSDNGSKSLTNLDGASSEQQITVLYTYYDSGRLKSASGSGTSRSDDGKGNITNDVITRLNAGWEPLRALTTPVVRRHQPV